MNDCCDKYVEGVAPGGTNAPGIQSINADTTPAQTIVGTNGVTVTTTGGVTNINGGGVGNVSGMTAPQLFVSPVTKTGGTLNLMYNPNTPLILTDSNNETFEDTRTNTNTNALAEAGYAAINDQGDKFEFIESGSGNTRRGVIRNASTAFGIDINQQGASKNIKLQTNSITRATIDDNGLSGIIGGTTPASGAFTTVTASTPIAPASGGSGINNPTAHNVLLGEGSSAFGLAAPGTSGNVLTSNGPTSDPTFQAVPGTSFPITPSQGGTGLTSLTAHNVIVGEGTSNVSLVSPSTSGFVLTSNGTSADPSFQANTGASISQVVMQASTTSTQSLSNSTLTTITNWTAGIDTATGFSANAYTIPFTGYYNIDVSITLDTAFSNYNGSLFVTQNGTGVLSTVINHPAISGRNTMQVYGAVSCTAADVFQVKVSQNSGGALAIVGASASNLWTVTSVGGQSSGSSGGSVTSVAANSTKPELSVSVTNPTTTPNISLAYSGTPAPVNQGGTGTTTSTGTGSVVLNNSPTFITPVLGTPSSGTMTNVSGTALSLTSGKTINITGGGAGYIPYQSAADTTLFLSNGTTGQILTSGGTGAPTWSTAGSNVVALNNVWTGTQNFQANVQLTNSATFTFISGTTLSISSGANIVLAGGLIINNFANLQGTMAVLSGGIISVSSGGTQVFTSGSSLTFNSGSTLIINSGGNITINGALIDSTGASGVSGRFLGNVSGKPVWVTNPSANLLTTNNTWTGTNQFNNTTTLGVTNLNDVVTSIGNNVWNAQNTFNGITLIKSTMGIQNSAVVNVNSGSSIEISSGANFTVDSGGSGKFNGKLIDSTGSSGTAGQFLVSQG